MHTARFGVFLGAFVLALHGADVSAEPVDCDAARCDVASAIDAECPCAAAVNHGRYTSCVARVVNRAARDGRIPTRCRGRINGCYIRSLCGKPARAVLCDRAGDGPGGRCRPLPSEAECRRGGGEVVATCCTPCDAASPTPTVAAPTPSATPGGPVATATAALPTATPVLPTATGTGTPAATVVVPTATTAAASPTSVATPAATATALATTTAVTTPVVIPTATATLTPNPVPTATGALPLLVFIDDADPDFGPPPLAVRFTSDVSGGTPPYTYRWSFGDGSPIDMTPNPIHVYGRLGDFTATLVVRDAAGREDSDEWDVTVEND